MLMIGCHSRLASNSKDNLVNRSSLIFTRLSMIGFHQDMAAISSCIRSMKDCNKLTKSLPSVTTQNICSFVTIMLIPTKLKLYTTASLLRTALIRVRSTLHQSGRLSSLWVDSRDKREQSICWRSQNNCFKKFLTHF